MINTLIKLALAETILKPVLIAITKHLLKEIIDPLYQKIDEQLVLPEQWESFVDKPYEWIYNTVLKEESVAIEKELLSSFLINEFNLNTFLGKVDERSR